MARVQCAVLCLTISHVQPLQRPENVCSTRLWTPLNIYAVCWGLSRKFVQEVVHTVYGQRRFRMLPVTSHSSKDLVSTFGPESCMITQPSFAMERTTPILMMKHFKLLLEDVPLWRRLSQCCTFSAYLASERFSRRVDYVWRANRLASTFSRSNPSLH
jgi:hypothetical protein